MYRNLDAEQARKRMSNSDVAEMLGISRNAYEKKKITGTFNMAQIVALLRCFNCRFEYLFETDEDKTA